jgi:hypothetical protein
VHDPLFSNPVHRLNALIDRCRAGELDLVHTAIELGKIYHTLPATERPAVSVWADMQADDGR